MAFLSNSANSLYGLKINWLRILFLLMLALVIYVSAQGFDPKLFIIAVVFLWVFIPSAIYLFWVMVQRAKRRHIQVQTKTLVVFSMCFLLSFSVALLQWPLRLNYALSKPALAQEAQQVAKNQATSFPRWVAGFYVLEATAKRNCVCFWTDTDPSGRTGIVYNLKGGQPPFNLWSSTSFGENWHLVSED